MVKNNHTFEKGEKFNGNTEKERYKIIGITDQKVTYQYIVEGSVLKSEIISKENARLFIRTGFWSKI